MSLNPPDQDLEILKKIYGEHFTNFLAFIFDKKIDDAINILKEHPEIIDFPIHIDLNINQELPSYPILFATRHNLPILVDAILDIKSNLPNYEDVKVLAFNTALQQGFLDVIKVFLKHDFDLKQKSNGNDMPLIYLLCYEAIKQQDFDLFIDLIKRGADINFQDEKGLTFLHFAANFNSYKIAEYLIQQGVDVNAAAPLFYGHTPLIVAACNNHFDMVKLLIQNQADIESHDIVGATPIFYAISNKNLEMVKYFVSNKAEIEHRIRIIFHLPGIKKGANVNYRHSSGKSVYSIAVETNNTEIINEIQNRGGYLHFIDKYKLE